MSVRARGVLVAEVYEKFGEEYVRAREGRSAVDLGAIFGDADILIMLPAAGEAVPFGATGDPRFNRIPTLLGTPCLTLPAGLAQSGLPLGVQLVARRHEDLRLLRAAVSVEQGLGTGIRLLG